MDAVCNGFNYFLVVQGREIRNMKTNQVKRKHEDEEEDSNKEQKIYTQLRSQETQIWSLWEETVESEQKRDGKRLMQQLCEIRNSKK